MPYTSQQVKVLCGTVDDWAILCCGVPGEIDNHYPKHPLLMFFKEHPVIFLKVTSTIPISGAPNIFTDGSKTGCGAYMIEQQEPVLYQYHPGSLQVVECKIVIEVFKNCSFPFNLVSDSTYVVNAVKILVVAEPIKPSCTVSALLQELQNLIWNRDQNFFVQHVREHTGLPRPLSAGNDKVDKCTWREYVFLSSSLDQAR